MGALGPGVAACYFKPRLASLLGQGFYRGFQTSRAFQSHAGGEGAAAGGGDPGPGGAEFAAGPDSEQHLKEEILQASLPFVHALGWSEDAIAQGAEALGYSSMAHGLFPGGGVELVNFFYGQCNRKLDEALTAAAAAAKEAQDSPKPHKSTTAFLAWAVEQRLRMNVEHLESWHRALALHAAPHNLPAALHNIGTLVDTIWHHAGDRSHDFRWYTKRGVLAAVYKSTELCMLQDQTPDFQNTWEFLDRRLSDLRSAGQCVREGAGLLQGAGSVARAGLLTALNVAGLNKRSRF